VAKAGLLWWREMLPCVGWGRARIEDVSLVKVKGVQGVVSDIFVSL